MFLKILTFVLPWPLRRRAMNSWFGYQIHPNAKIGLSWIFPRKLVMEDGSAIGHFNVAIHLDQIKMGKKSKIGRGNWMTGFPTQTQSRHFAHQPERKPELHIGTNTAITKNHHLDCTNLITIGSFTTIAGYQSQLLTHSIDVMENHQSSAPIHIGDYCFISTNVVLLGGAKLPSYTVLGAKSLLNKAYTEEWKLYGGVPARPIRELSKEAKYFARVEGFVY